MKLILIHGRGQEGSNELALKKTWTDTLLQGLAKSGLTLPANVQIELPYYGNLLKELVDKADAASPPQAATRGLSVDTSSKENALYEALLRDMAKKSKIIEKE